MSEAWRWVAEFEGFYEVSDAGRVRSVDRVYVRADGRRQRRLGRILRQNLLGTGGYPSVTLRFGQRRTVHTLVCATFHGPKPSPKHEVAHWDGDPENNAVSNLRWVTHRENVKDSERHGTKSTPPRQVGEDVPSRKLTWADVDEIRRRAFEGESALRISRDFPIGKNQTQNVINRRNWLEVERPEGDDPAWAVS